MVMRTAALQQPPLLMLFAFVTGAMCCLLLLHLTQEAEQQAFKATFSKSTAASELEADPAPAKTTSTLAAMPFHIARALPDIAMARPQKFDSEPVSEQQWQKVRILCLIITYPGNHYSKARHVQSTWARRCSRVIFVTNEDPLTSDANFVQRVCEIISEKEKVEDDLKRFGEQHCFKNNDGVTSNIDFNSESTTLTQLNLENVSYSDWFDPPFPAIKISHTTEDRYGLWNKTKQGFLHAFTHFRDEYDWFLKTDDDTYVIMENLRNFLQYYSPKDPMYFGCTFRKTNDKGYMSGGGGYVLSREALVRFSAVMEANETLIPITEAEDVNMGRVLQSAGVTFGESRDGQGRPRFLPLAASYMAHPDDSNKPTWYWQLTGYSHSSGPDCCSPTAISFHYMLPFDMYFMEMMLYHITVHGIHPTEA